MIFAAGLVVAAAIAGTSAQGTGGVSPACQSAATAVLAGPAGACLGVADLLNIAMLPANQSLVQPLDKWLTDTCPQPACTSAVLDAAFTNLTTGCHTELGFTTNIIGEFETWVAEWYPTARDVACLKDSNAGGAFCMTTTFQAIEKYIGMPLSKNTLPMVVLGLESMKTPVPKDMICTACTQAAYALIRPKLNDTSRGTWDGYLGGECGSSFTSGSSPSSIQQGANNSPPQGSGAGQGNGALAVSTGVLGTLATALLGVAGVAVLGL
ncbi:hypothetical protein FRC10_011089 [Ceratobasidium sp. 414]|nr:hypothetical protein FRC10_011089 [Ceratobasidium sp. 414]